MYLTARHAGNIDEMLFIKDYLWFKSLNIHYAVGVDGISVAMICLTSLVVFAGIFASWEVEFLKKEFFISLILLATGVFGFFISIDLFTMFLFYELAVIPMYLLIGIWGSGPKEYSAMKLTLMLMGGSALLLLGLLGIYFNSSPDGSQFTFNILEISKVSIPISAQRLFFPTDIRWLWCAWRIVPVPYMVSRWTCFCSNCGFNAPCRCSDEAWRIRRLQGGYLPYA